jgi:putative ABC transport system permease protein
METLVQDIRYTFRTLSKAPGFTAVIIVSIALAIAANVTIFSVANGLLWSALPVRDQGRLVVFSEGESFSYPDYVDFREQTKDIFEGGVCAHFPLIPASVGSKGEPERIWGQAVSGNYFSVVGVVPALGRGIQPSDDEIPGRHAVVVLSHALWQRRFASDPTVIGHDAVLNGRRYTVVGVTPAGFAGTDHGLQAQFWVPLAMAETIMPDLGHEPLREKRDSQWLNLNARLKPGVTHMQAVAALNLVKKRIDDTYRKDEKQHRPAVTLDPAGGLIAGSATPALGLISVLMVVTGLVLLVACANVANLLLARATSRQREIAIRLAMGARRMRLIRQLLTESILLAGCGATLGFGLAAVAAHAISSFQLPIPFPIVFDFNVDLRVLAFTVGLTVFTGILFGLVPALRATRPDLVPALKNESTAFVRLRGFGLRNGLVVVQVALSLALLASAGLFLRSLQNASSIDLGMNPHNILLMTVDPKLHGYSREKTQQFLDTLRQRVQSLPGARSVSFVDSLPLSIGGTSFTFSAPSGKGGSPKDANADVYNIGTEFFDTLGIPLERGRDFNRQADDEHVAIINQTMASNLFGKDDPLGRQVTADKVAYTIIGVARNSKSRTLGEGPKNCAYLFLEPTPDKIMSFFGITLAVKTTVNPNSLMQPVRAEIAALDPTLAVFNTDTMQDHVSKSFLLPRISALILGIVGWVGLTLAAIGLYGVMSYSVRRRTHEIGIRMALGAEPGKVLRMVLRQGLTVTAVGLAIGLAIALALGRFTATLLYGISGTDLATFVTVPAVLAAAAFAAILVPASRAARVEPSTALRYE